MAAGVVYFYKTFFSVNVSSADDEKLSSLSFTTTQQMEKVSSGESSSDQLGNGDQIKRISVDDIYESVDKLVLTVFETMRQANMGEVPSDPQAHAQQIVNQYKSILNSIDNLSGISKSPEILDAQLEKVSQEYEESRKAILILEQKLEKIQGIAEEKLNAVSNVFNMTVYGIYKFFSLLGNVY